MKISKEKKQKLLEQLAKLEHERWMKWAKYVLENETISEETRKRWEKDFAPYEQLPEEVKERDRVFARKNLNIFEQFLSQE